MKTLHPRIHGGILALRENPAHQATLASMASSRSIWSLSISIPSLTSSPVPRCRARRRSSRSTSGGRLWFARRRRIFSRWRSWWIADYAPVLNDLHTTGVVSAERRRRLAQKAFAHTAQYDALIAAYLSQDQPPWQLDGGPDGAVFPETLTLTYNKVQDLRYGEIRTRPRRFIATGSAAVCRWPRRSSCGAELCPIPISWMSMRLWGSCWSFPEVPCLLHRQTYQSLRRGTRRHPRGGV